MIKQEEINDFFKNVKSKALFDELSHLDAIYYNQEVELKKLRKDNKELHKQYMKFQNEQMDKSNSMIADSLKATISYPTDINNIGIVGAAILVRIREMKSIKKIHEYIDEIGKRATSDKSIEE